MTHAQMIKQVFLLCRKVVLKLLGSIPCLVLCISLAIFWVSARGPGPKLCQEPCKLLGSLDICRTVLNLASKEVDCEYRSLLLEPM